LKHIGFTNYIDFSTVFVNSRQPVICGVHGGSAAMNRGADYVEYLVQALRA